MTASNLDDYVKKHGAKMIDAKFVDFLGGWKHLTYPIERLHEGLEEGFGFDGSSVAGWRAINSSDMLMKPDPATAIMDPFLKVPTLSILCDVIDPITHESYLRCPRSLAKRAISYLKSTGIADTAYFGPEAEFFIFDSIQYSEEPEPLVSSRSTPTSRLGTTSAPRSGATRAASRRSRAATASRGRWISSPTCAPRW